MMLVMWRPVAESLKTGKARPPGLKGALVTCDCDRNTRFESAKKVRRQLKIDDAMFRETDKKKRSYYLLW